MKKILSITIFALASLHLIYLIDAWGQFNDLTNRFGLLIDLTGNGKKELIYKTSINLIVLLSAALGFFSSIKDEEEIEISRKKEALKEFEKKQSDYRTTTEIIKTVINVENKYLGVKNLEEDSYKLFLVNKYKVVKNDVFNKYVYREKLFDSLDELLILLDNEENKIFQSNVNTEIINTESYNEFVRIRTDCLIKITKNGTSVKTEGSYPNMKWSIINEHGSSIKQLKNLQELIDYAKVIK